MQETKIRDASSVIIVREDGPVPTVLMGQRGKTAAFMPNKFVFPGGAVDPIDADVKLVGEPNEICLNRLKKYSNINSSTAFLTSAIREVWEETGLMFGKKFPKRLENLGNESWDSFFKNGYGPSAKSFRFIFRAITPPNRTRRFDARFFLADANLILGQLDDFSDASDELSHLQWVSFEEARKLDLPFITEIVLAEAEALTLQNGPPDSVPFFNNSQGSSDILRIY